MSTHSRIGLQHPDTTITSIYCHWDGFPTHVGRILTEHYSDEGRIMALLALGNLSELGPEIGEAHDFRSHGVTHPTWCLAYERDRGDADAMPSVAATHADYLELARDCDAQYVYLFMFGDWYAYSGRTASYSLVRAALLAEQTDKAA